MGLICLYHYADTFDPRQSQVHTLQKDLLLLGSLSDRGLEGPSPHL